MLDAVLVVDFVVVVVVVLGLDNILILHVVALGPVDSVKGSTTLLRTNEEDNNGESADSTEKNSRDLCVGGDIFLNRRSDTSVPLGVERLEVGTTDSFDLGRSRGSSVTELVGDTREGGTESSRCDLGEVDGNDTPASLDTELKEEGAGSETAESGGQDPGRDHGSDEEDEDNHGETTSKVLRGESRNHTTANGTDVGNDVGTRSLLGGKELGLFEHGNIKILRGVREEVHSGHEEDSPNEATSVFLSHVLNILSPGPERGLAWLQVGLTLSLLLDEEGRFGEACTKDTGEAGETGAKEEKDAPVAALLNPSEVDASGKNVADTPALLHDTGEETSGSDWHVLEGVCRCKPPNSTHCNAEKGSEGKELCIGLDEAGTKREGSDEHEVDNEGPLTTVSIRNDTENDGTDGTEEESEGDGGGDVLDRLIELLGKSGDRKREGKEIPGVHGPSEPTSEKVGPVHLAKHTSQLDGVGGGAAKLALSVLLGGKSEETVGDVPHGGEMWGGGWMRGVRL